LATGITPPDPLVCSMIAHLTWLQGLLQFNTSRDRRISDPVTVPELNPSKKLARLAATIAVC